MKVILNNAGLVFRTAKQEEELQHVSIAGVLANVDERDTLWNLGDPSYGTKVFNIPVGTTKIHVVGYVMNNYGISLAKDWVYNAGSPASSTYTNVAKNLILAPLGGHEPIDMEIDLAEYGDATILIWSDTNENALLWENNSAKA